MFEIKCHRNIKFEIGAQHILLNAACINGISIGQAPIPLIHTIPYASALFDELFTKNSFTAKRKIQSAKMNQLNEIYYWAKAIIQY